MSCAWARVPFARSISQALHSSLPTTEESNVPARMPPVLRPMRFDRRR